MDKQQLHSKEPESIRRVKMENESRLQRELNLVTRLRDIQIKVMDWVQQAQLSWVQLSFGEPGSSGYRHTVIDIHSPDEAYIWWSDGGYRYKLLVSIFENDFADLPRDDSYRGLGYGTVLYACKGLLEIDLSPEIIEACSLNGRSCCHHK